jgi:hypothetical protein
MHREKIHKLAVELKKKAQSRPHYLSSYSRARTQVERKFTENQRQRYKAMAKEWSEKKPPPIIQQRYVPWP